MSNNKQQTAVDWLAEKLFCAEPNILEWQKYIEQAKEMEKKQMIECYLKADVFPRRYEFEKWYNEIYGGNK